jgi:hypothetical protein
MPLWEEPIMPLADWTHIRVKKTTKQLLADVRASMELGESLGLRELPHGTHEEVSFDAIIVELIYSRLNHARRRRESAARRKRKSPLLDQLGRAGKEVQGD